MRLFLLSMILLSCAMVLPLKASANDIVCEKSSSTATTIACLKKKLQNNQALLNDVYADIAETLSGDRGESFKDLQKSWLNYRDAECMWEVEQLKGASLHTLHELRCMDKVTRNRIELLSSLHNDEAIHNLSDINGFPRWMNVAAQEKPDIYWRYGERMAVDLNCDDDNEYVMQGLAVKKEESYIVVAIAQNPEVGRPKLQYLSAIPSELDSCNVPYTLKTLSKAQEEASCNIRLALSAADCKNQEIKWDGKEFKILTDNNVEKEK